MTNGNSVRHAAMKRGNRRYESPAACQECGTHERYVSNGACVACQLAANRKAAMSENGKAANRARQAAYRARNAARIKSLLDDI